MEVIVLNDLKIELICFIIDLKIGMYVCWIVVKMNARSWIVGVCNCRGVFHNKNDWAIGSDGIEYMDDSVVLWELLLK